MISKKFCWTMGLACLLMMSGVSAWADEEQGAAETEAEAQAALAETEQAKAETLEKLRQAQQQLEQIEAQRAETMRKIQNATQKLQDAQREEQAARDKLNNANVVLKGIEQERALATRQLVDAAISTTAQPEEADGQEYPVTGLIIEYETDHPGLPTPEELVEVKVRLLRTMSGFIAPRKDEISSQIRLLDVPDLTENRFYASAVKELCRALVSYFNEEGLIGVYVGPAASQISRDGNDLRAEGQTTLKLIVRVAILENLRTVGSGPGNKAGQRINSPSHARLMSRSRLQPAVAGEPGSGSLLKRGVLNEQINLWNRHPGRHVEVAISASDTTPGGAQLDLLINELKPWTIYAQVSNTGTESTDRWRERFGFQHNNLTGNDDILSIDYLTAGFDNVHSVVASYEAPLMGSDRVRWRVHGLWSEYSASDLGQVPEAFTGDEVLFGGEVIANVYQRDRLFVDLVGGVAWRKLRTSNELLLVNGETDLLLPHIGAKFENSTDTSRTTGAASLKYNVLTFDDHDEEFGAGANPADGLGRIDTEEKYLVLEWDLTHSTYLEPLLNREAWEDPTTPSSSTLAHELFLAVRGQTSFGDRLIAQEEMTLGGLYTVRGYEQSEVDGDSAMVATAEYRYHVPRAMAIRAEPGSLFGRPFKWARQQVYGQSDWDLVLRAFLDAGFAHMHGRLIYENNETMIGTGVGVELLVKRNLSVRADWGIALDGTERTDSGHNEVHFVATVLY